MYLYSISASIVFIFIICVIDEWNDRHVPHAIDCDSCNHLMIVVGDNTVKIWDAVTGHVEATLEGHRYGVNSVAISHDGATIVSVSGSGE